VRRPGIAVRVRTRRGTTGVGAADTAVSLAAQTQPADVGPAEWMFTLRPGDVLIADALESMRVAAPRLRMPACWVPVLGVERITVESQGRLVPRVLSTPRRLPAEQRGTRRLLRRRGIVGLIATTVLLLSRAANNAAFEGKPLVIVPLTDR
jgi:hypothetical protein